MRILLLGCDVGGLGFGFKMTILTLGGFKCSGWEVLTVEGGLTSMDGVNGGR